VAAFVLAPLPMLRPPPSVGAMDESTEELGPVDYLIVAFPGSRFQGEIAPALAELVESGTIRLIDVAFVTKDDAGETATLEVLELDPEAQAGLESLGIEATALFNEDDLEAAAVELDPGSSAVLLVWENLWAKKVAQAMRDAGGVIFDFDRLPHDVVQNARDFALAQN
jgi:uncharacterized membrane protein